MERYYWFEQLFWEIGQMVIQFLKGNINGAVEMTYWIRIHISQSGKCIRTKIKPIQVIKNKLTALFGLFMVVLVIYIINTFIKSLI